MPVYWPNGTLTRPRATSEFNPARKNPVTGIVQPHNGIDLVGWVDNCSPVDGTVIFAGYNGGAGNEVRIRADGPTAFHVGDVFRILHHASLYVRTGMRVTARQAVGRMGTTGNSTGVHCHFETHEFRYGNPINPRDFMARANASAAGGGSTPREWDIMATRDEIKVAVAEALVEARYGTGNRNLFDLGNDARGYAERAAIAAEASTPAKIWTHPVPAQDAKGLPILRDGKPVTYQAQGYLASAVAQLQANPGVDVDEAALAKALAPLLADHLGALSDEDVKRLAVAAADENARRLQG